MPHTPDFRFSQNVLVSLPTGEITPVPVMTTLLMFLSISKSFIVYSYMNLLMLPFGVFTNGS